MSQPSKAFNPQEHMRKIRTRQGMQDYLDVKWRIAWLRSEHPDAQIVTELIESSETHARFKATITIYEGIRRGEEVAIPFKSVATGHGSETQADFPDFFEKAETKAIGRACAVLGYGTDTAFDFEDPIPEPSEQTVQTQPKPAPTPEQRLDGHHGAATVPLKGPRPVRPPKDDDEFLNAALPARPPAQKYAQNKGTEAPRINEDVSNANHLKETAGSAPLPNPAQADGPSNIHQHAQLRTLAENGLDLSSLLARYGVSKVEDLGRMQARDAIIAARELVKPR